MAEGIALWCRIPEEGPPPAERWEPLPGGVPEPAGPEALPELGPDELQLLLFPLDVSVETGQAARQLLVDEERARADRFVRPQLGSRFAIGRAWLRRALARHLGIPASAVSLATLAEGKPVLSAAGCLGQGSAGGDVHFNLAHSEGLGLLGLRRRGPVGVDLELPTRTLGNLDGLARIAFHPAERGALRSTPPEQGAALFLHWWTLKEAVLKALGTGLAGGARQLDLSAFPPGGREHTVDYRERHWRCLKLCPPGGAVAAVAFDLGPLA